VEYMSARQRLRLKKKGREAQAFPSGMLSRVRDSFSGAPVWCVQVSEDLAGGVQEGSVVAGKAEHQNGTI
jgi:hypothetical protein